MEKKGLHAREFILPNGEIRTDSLLYREKCRLLLPEPYTQNMFIAHGNQYQTRYYIASDSMRNVERMGSFFSRLYGTVFQETGLPVINEINTVLLKNSLWNVRKKEFYHPAFVRNILDYASMGDSAEVRYCVTVRAGKQSARASGRYNFGIAIGFSTGNARRKFSDLLEYELKTMRRDAGYSLRKARLYRMGDNLLSNPFNLINFIRVPAEKDLVL